MAMTMIMNALGKKQRAPPSLLCGKTFLGRVNTKTAPIVLTDDQGDDADDHDDLDDDHDHHDDYLNDDHDDNQVFLMTEFGDDNVAYHSITFFFASIFVTQILRHFFAPISHRSIKISLTLCTMPISFAPWCKCLFIKSRHKIQNTNTH